MAWWAGFKQQAEDVWQQFVLQWEIATAGAQDMQWVDTLDFFWDSLPDGDKLTAKEKRQIAASLKHLVRQQSTDLYHKQQSHKEAIMRRQAMLAQQHLEQLASKRLEQMMTMSYIAKEQSALLPSVSQLLANLSRQQSPTGSDGSDQQQQAQTQQQQATLQRHSSSGSRAHQRRQLPSSRLGSSQRLASVLEQQGSLQQVDMHSSQSLSIQQHLQPEFIQPHLEFGALSELQPAQEHVQDIGAAAASTGADAAVVIDIPGDHFSFLPLAAAVVSSSSSWPRNSAGDAARRWPAGNSSRSSSGSPPDWREAAGSWGSRDGGSGWWGRGGNNRQRGLSEPLLQQHEEEQEVQPISDTSANTAAAAEGAEAPQTGLLLERYLNSNNAVTVPSATAAAAAAADQSYVGAGDLSTCGTPIDTLHSLQSDDSVASSSTDASSDQPLLQDGHVSPHDQQQPFDRLSSGAAAAAGACVNSRCSCDTTSADIDTPRKVRLGPPGGCCACVDGVCAGACAGSVGVKSVPTGL